MSGKTSKFLIGLFVMGGVIIGAGIIVWIGASKYFQKGSTYVTFFDESVQGLQMDSSVKYRGVDVRRGNCRSKGRPQPPWGRGIFSCPGNAARPGSP